MKLTNDQWFAEQIALAKDVSETVDVTTKVDIVPGSMWTSYKTSRSCRVLWVSELQVEITFMAERGHKARKVHDRATFERCYMPV